MAGLGFAWPGLDWGSGGIWIILNKLLSYVFTRDRDERHDDGGSLAERDVERGRRRLQRRFHSGDRPRPVSGAAAEEFALRLFGRLREAQVPSRAADICPYVRLAAL